VPATFLGTVIDSPVLTRRTLGTNPGTGLGPIPSWVIFGFCDVL